MKQLLLCVVVGFHLSAALAQPTSPPAQDSEKRFTAPPQIRFMAELKTAEAAAEPAFVALSTSTTSVDRRKIVSQYSSALQRLGTNRSFVGDDQGAIAAFDAMSPSGRIAVSPANKEIIDSSSVEDAISAIVKMASKRQVVIINEAHHVSMHRAFGLTLAKELKKIGFTHLAVEALDPADLDPLDKGYADFRSGYYVREPVFAQFLRETKASGWTLVSYESISPSGNLSRTEQVLSREIGQAKNIVDRIFSQKPDAKVLIYVGYAHAAKVALPWPGERPMAWMAAQLKKLTGIDPLTIDQSILFERNVALPANAVFQEVVSTFSPTAPIVIKRKDGSAGVFEYPSGAFDLQVLHPPTKRTAGRATWLMTLANRRPVDIPVSLLSDKSRRLIYAFHEGDPASAAPADVVLVTPGSPVPKFMLPPGKFRYEYEE